MTGKPAGENLSGGARLVASVAKNRMITAAIWRFGKEVGAVEERTFMKLCAIPEWATRAPMYTQWKRPARDGSGDWYVVTFLWFEEAHQNG